MRFNVFQLFPHLAERSRIPSETITPFPNAYVQETAIFYGLQLSCLVAVVV